MSRLSAYSLDVDAMHSIGGLAVGRINQLRAFIN